MARTTPLRILYSFPHRVGAPGIGTTALNQVRALADLGASVTLVCTSLHAEVPSSVVVRETLRWGGKRIPHRAFGTADRAIAYHDRRVARFLRDSDTDFDVVHTWPQSCLATIRAASLRGVLSSREVPNTHTANAYAEAEKEAAIVGITMGRRHSHRPNRRHLDLEEEEYARADLLLVPSAHVKDTFLARGVSEDRLRRHQYGYDSSRFSAYGRTETPTRPFTAVFVGSAEPRKGLHYALRAWIDAGPPQDSRFLIAGGFVEGYREVLQNDLAHPTVEAMGFVNDVPALLRRSDVLLLPSVEEGSALVTYEAQASGCIPLVSSAAGALLPAGFDDLVHQPRDVSELTRQVRLVMHDPGLRAPLRQKVIAWSSSLTWSAAGRRMLDIYDSELEDRDG